MILSIIVGVILFAAIVVFLAAYFVAKSNPDGKGSEFESSQLRIAAVCAIALLIDIGSMIRHYL